MTDREFCKDRLKADISKIKRRLCGAGQYCKMDAAAKKLQILKHEFPAHVFGSFFLCEHIVLVLFSSITKEALLSCF